MPRSFSVLRNDNNDNARADAFMKPDKPLNLQV
jgi:hypothetical protein